MSRRVLLIAGAGIALVGTFAALGAAAAPSKEADLAEEVKALKKQVAQLENRLKALESSSPGIVISPQWQNPASPPERRSIERLPETSPGNLPPGTMQREFNGLTYYVMPIKEPATSPSR